MPRTRADYREHSHRSRATRDYHNTAMDSNPLSLITWHSAFWAADPSWTPPADGAAVSSWRNAGTAAANATQATGAAQPLYQTHTTALGNRATIQFQGTDDVLQTATFTAVAVPYSLIVIGQYTVSGTPSIIGGQSNSFRMGANTAWLLRSGGSARAGGTFDTRPHLFRGSIATGNDTLAVDETVMFSNLDSGDSSITRLTLGSDSSTQFLTGHIAFAGLYSGTITGDSGWAAFKAWAGAYYQLSIA